MDAAPRGLAPSGPGATGAPLVDCILCDPGLAASVLSHLAPRDVVGLRAACRAGRDAVAGHAWEPAAEDLAWPWLPSLPSLGDSIRAAAIELARSRRRTDVGDALVWQRCCGPPDLSFDLRCSGGRKLAAALARWRACFPHARSVVVNGEGCVNNDDDDATGDVDDDGDDDGDAEAGDSGDGGAVAADRGGTFDDASLAALAAGGGGRLARLGLLGCASLTDGALAPFDRLASLVLVNTRSLSGACWGGLAGRLRSVATAGSYHALVRVSDAHLPALAGCSHVYLGAGAAVTGAGVATHLSARVTHLGLDVARCVGFDGSCLRSCTRLVELRLVNDYEIDSGTGDAVRRLAGCAGGLASLELVGVDGGDALFAAAAAGGGGRGLPALRWARLCRLPSLTDAAFAGGATPALAELEVQSCNAFVGGAGLGHLPSLTSLFVYWCGRRGAHWRQAAARRRWRGWRWWTAPVLPRGARTAAAAATVTRRRISSRLQPGWLRCRRWPERSCEGHRCWRTRGLRTRRP
jgi:hypothetical protein